MSLGDRFLKIAKSYLSSATDSLEDEWSHLSEKWEQGELSDEMYNRLKNLKDEVTKKKSNASELDDDEVEKILRNSGYTDKSDHIKSKYNKPTTNRKKDQLERAYQRLGVNPSDSWDKIEKSYKKQLMKFHPDRFPSDEDKAKSATKLSQMISEAYQLIKNLEVNSLNSNFRYTVKDKRGKVTSGTVAESKDSLRENLIALNFDIVSIRQLNVFEVKILDLKHKILNVPTKDVILFFRQFSATLKAGIPIPVILENIARTQKNKIFKETLNDIGGRIKRGESLSASFANHTRVFQPLLIAVLKAGEIGGFLERVIERYTTTLEKENEMKKKVVGALTYPAIVLGIAFLVIIGLFFTVVPKIKKMFRARKMDLPVVTEVLFLTSDFISNYWFVLIPGLVGGGVGVKSALQTGKLRYYWDMYILKIPIVGELLLMSIMARFCHILVNLQDAGVSLIQSLDILEAIFGNDYLTTKFRAIKKEITEGKGLGESFERTGIFPPIVVQMVTVGEQSGRLSEMLSSVAAFFEQEVEYAVKNLTSMIEPLLIVGLGGTVLFIALALLMPIINLTKNV